MCVLINIYKIDTAFTLSTQSQLWQLNIAVIVYCCDQNDNKGVLI